MNLLSFQFFLYWKPDDDVCPANHAMDKEIAAITSIAVLIQLNKDVVVQIFPWFKKFQINLTLIFRYLQSITVTFSTKKIELQYH